MPDSDVREITEPIELKLVDDRLHFTCISGKRRRTYSISFHKAANAAMATEGLLHGREREARILRLEKRG